MMQLAVTNHAVERYKNRVVSAAKLDDEAVRKVIREMVTRAFEVGGVQDHPGHPERRMIPVMVGKDSLYIALGPNTTEYPGDWAVIGVLFDREVGRNTTGATLGDLIPESKKLELAEAVKEPEKTKSRFLVLIGQASRTPEFYYVKDEKELQELIQRRKPAPEVVEVFERLDLTIEQVYVVKTQKK